MFHRIAASLFLTSISVVTLGGCSGTPKVENEAATEGIQAVVDQLNASQGEIDKVLASIDQLQAPGDMKTAYANYVAAVGSVRKAGERVRDRREAMQAKRDEYIARWQKELESISNPDVKAALVERKERVSANYSKIATEVATVRDDYLPFLKNLEEIQKALALDLNPSGITAMKKPLDQAKADGVKLKASISRLQGELNSIIGSMAPATAPVTPATAPAKSAAPTAPVAPAPTAPAPK